MTKAQMVSALSEKIGLSKKETKQFLDDLASMAYSEVATNGEFVLPGFGKMVKVNRKARMGVNPATGENRTGTALSSLCCLTLSFAQIKSCSEEITNFTSSRLSCFAR